MPETHPPPYPPTDTPRGLLDLWGETGVVLLVCVVPLMFASTGALFVKQEAGPFLYQALYTVVRSAGAIGLVLFVVSRSGEPPARFGLQRLRPGRDVLEGVGTFVLGLAGYYGLWIALAIGLGSETLAAISAHDLSAIAPPAGTGWVATLVVMSLANGVAEEVVMRAYLIPRFEQLFGGAPLALLLSTAIFASYHAYQGPGGVVSAAALGLVYGAVFCVTRRLWPIAIAHALQDVVGLAMIN